MRYFRVLTLSLAIHLLLAFGLTKAPVSNTAAPEQLTFIDLVEKPELPRRPQQPSRNEKIFVRSAPVPEDVKTKEKRESRFSSEEESYVLQEQKARASGLTENRSNTGPAAEPEPARKAKKPGERKTAKRDDLDLKPRSALDKAKQELATDEFERDVAASASLGDVSVRRQEAQSRQSESRELDLRRFSGLSSGMSTVGEALPDDIRFGDFTALNTDRHLYYSFYARMEEQIRHRWITYARAALYNLPPNAKRFSESDTWTTKLEVHLDREGNFLRAVLQGSSGIRSLDSAPTQAFKDAAKFPHPPPEMVKPDGTIRIFYSFSVNVTSRFAGRD